MGSAVQQWGWFADAQESRFQAAKSSEIYTDVPQGGWFVDAQESRIQNAKRSDMSIAVMKILRFADNQESCFEAWKRSHMGCASLLSSWFADFQELCFEAWIRSNMCSALLEGGRPYNLTNLISSCKTFRHELCRNASNIHVSKIWDNCSDFPQGSRFPVVHK